ncbi:MAG: site-specific DNA-methyltransferase [Selenomonadaceae bacterium]|nr:site-specific DNA-methyltransferase [Selenomonadaceae bacterium]MBO6305234.1 site-specific DNA-methyltransferase [Selenomonadaceae bacterium]
MKGKLELTWAGKDEPLLIEPRILLYDEKKSYGAQDTGNILIHGDNLLALKALEKKYAGEVKCIYIDPPYNADSLNEYYDDNFEHSEWIKRMYPRLEILQKLLVEEGTIFIQINDDEQAYLKVICDEIFGRRNFINIISVNMKNIAGASGGGEDKRIKKNCEYILVYAKNYSALVPFTGPYVYTEMSDLIASYLSEGKSWKYTTVLINPGEKVFIGKTLDGSGNEIKVYSRCNYEMMSVKQVANRDGISEKEAYKKYGTKIFRTTNAQTSIRTRIIKFRQDNNIHDELLSIEYVPQTGKNKGSLYEQFYKDDICNLFVWLKDTSEIIDDVLYKRDLLGTYWDMNAWMKNLTKEGNVEFSNGKKPEYLVKQIIEMSTNPGDLVLDSFLGSGTTGAVAHKMNRRYIGIEMGEHAYTHCKTRLDKVIDGTDAGGITKSVNWQGGGGYRFYELAPTLVNIDLHGEPIISKEYNAEQLAAAVALHEGYTYAPDSKCFWKQAKGSNNSYLFVTTQTIDLPYLDIISKEMQQGEYLTIAASVLPTEMKKPYRNISLKYIPQMLLKKCKFGVTNDYNLPIIEPPKIEEEEDEG